MKKGVKIPIINVNNNIDINTKRYFIFMYLDFSEIPRGF